MVPAGLVATEQAYGKVHPRVALVLSSLGFVAIQLGTLDDAEAYFMRIPDDGDSRSELMSITIPNSCR